MNAGAREFRLGGSGAVQIIFERNCERRIIGGGGARKAGRRHHAGAQLADYLFPGLGLRGYVCGIELIERQVGGLESLVVTGYAILIQQLPFGRGWKRRRRGLSSD